MAASFQKICRRISNYHYVSNPFLHKFVCGEQWYKICMLTATDYIWRKKSITNGMYETRLVIILGLKLSYVFPVLGYVKEHSPWERK